jgi:hypothetical protein
MRSAWLAIGLFLQGGRSGCQWSDCSMFLLILAPFLLEGEFLRIARVGPVQVPPGTPAPSSGSFSLEGFRSGLRETTCSTRNNSRQFRNRNSKLSHWYYETSTLPRPERTA